MTPKRAATGRIASKFVLIAFVASGLATIGSRASAQLLNSQSMIESTLLPLPLREGQIVDGLSTLVIRDGRLSTSEINVLPQDEVWLLDGRQCHLNPNDLSQIHARRLIGNSWVHDALENLVAGHGSDKTKTTMIYAHGNRTDEDWAIWRGLQFYHNTFGNSGHCRPPVRFVIWSWQSEQGNYRLSKDYKVKSARAVIVGHALANLLCQFTDRQMVLVGFSLGSQAFLSALSQPRLQCPFDPGKPGRYQVALIAPALDGCFVSNQINRYPNSVAVQRTVIFDNTVDRALRVSKLVRRRQCPAGDTPLPVLAARGNLPLTLITFKNMSNEVGKGHSVDRYTSTPTIRNELNQMLYDVAKANEIVPSAANDLEIGSTEGFEVLEFSAEN